MSDTKKETKAQKVVFAKFHGELFFVDEVSKVGTQLTNVLPPSNKALEGLNMYLSEHGLIVEIGKKTKLLVPYSNVVNLKLANE